MRPLCIDLFCGYGGWARGFLDAGYRVVGFDNEPKCAKRYPGEFVLADVRDLDGRRFTGARVIVASPPCQKFSNYNYRTRNPDEGMVLVREAIRVIREAGPTFWAIENVRSSVRYISQELGTPRIRNQPWYIWGEFPGFLLPKSNHFYKGELRPPKRITFKKGPSAGITKTVYRWGFPKAAEAAIIPLAIANGLAEACLP